MSDEYIIDLYKKGFSIDYITKQYYKFLNKKNKPIYIEGTKFYPTQLYSKSDCRLRVVSIIYNKYILKKLSCF